MARMRYVKPELVAHPVYQRWTDAAQNLALVLPMYADDEGYFLADPILIRNFAKPRAAVEEIQGALTELSRSGVFEIRESPTHGPLGRIFAALSGPGCARTASR